MEASLIKPIFGVVADDITGAGDIALMFNNAGLSTNIFRHQHLGGLALYPSDVVVIDTDSRFIAPEEAKQRVYEATKALMGLGAQHYCKKTCSVFRGNIGAEFDGFLEALKLPFAPIILGFPDNGRTTVQGLHYVRGTLLEESEFAKDPVNPMHTSVLADIVGEQSEKNVSNIFYDAYASPETLASALSGAAQKGGYTILDVRNNADLALIGEAIHTFPAFLGASAIAYPIGCFYKSVYPSPVVPPAYNSRYGVLAISGSLMPQTLAQIEYATTHGVAGLPLVPEELLANTNGAVQEYARKAAALIRQKKDVLVYSSPCPQDLAHAETVIARQGITRRQFGNMISSALGEIARQVLAESGQSRVLVAGGDTSEGFCNSLQVQGMAVWKEVENGLPSCISLSSSPLLMVLKSGSFGSKEFFVKALQHLKEN